MDIPFEIMVIFLCSLIQVSFYQRLATRKKKYNNNITNGRFKTGRNFLFKIHHKVMILRILGTLNFIFPSGIISLVVHHQVIIETNITINQKTWLRTEFEMNKFILNH